MAQKELPEDMVAEILKRLPVKSLLVSKAVCKPWLYLISNPKFIKSQLQHATVTSLSFPILLSIINPAQCDPSYENYDNDILVSEDYMQIEQNRNDLVREALVRSGYLPEISSHYCDFLFRNQGLSTNLLNRIINMPRPFTYTRVVGCCNGIICLSSMTKEVYLWNPCIRQYCKKLLNSSPSMVGFGYDSISDDYKIVRLIAGNHPNYIPTVQLYSVNADSCRQFQAPSLKDWMLSADDFILGLGNICINGVLYFDDGNELLLFDMHKEVVELVPFPSFIQKRSNVLDFEGCVAMLFKSGTGFDLWTLDSVSDVLVWTKKFSMECGLDDRSAETWLSCYLGVKQFYGIKFLNRTDVVYEFFYDYEKKEIKCHEFREEYLNSRYGDSGYPVRANMKYTETLVSLDGFRRLDENAKN